jgi:hypothetical protein
VFSLAAGLFDESVVLVSTFNCRHDSTTPAFVLFEFVFSGGLAGRWFFWLHVLVSADIQAGQQ